MLVLLMPARGYAQSSIEIPDAGVTADAASAPPPPAPAAAAADDVPITASTVDAVIGVRSLVYAQNPATPDELDDVGATGEVNVLLSGQVHRFLKWQAGFIGVLGDPGSPSAALLDLAAKLEIADSLHLWIGRMPVPSDRTSLSTVWALAPWTLPGRYDSFAPIPSASARPDVGPRRGPLGREDGVTLWGQLRGGRFKYYAGVFGLGEPSSSPLFSARLALSLLAPEPGYGTRSSYFGSQKVLGLGVGAQHRGEGSRGPEGSLALPDDFDEINGDILFETGNESAGVLDLEGAFARMWGSNERAKYQLVFLASYLLPLDVGIGRFQPLFRIQRAERGAAEDAATFTSIDAQLGYVIDGHNARVSTGYQYTRIDGQPRNAVLFGVQLLSKGN